MQDRVIAGDTLDFVTSLPDFPAGTYTLKFRLIPRSSGTPVTLTCTASGADHRCTADATTTGALAAGNWSWFSWVEKGSERYSVSEGQLVVVANPATQTTFDNRSDARQVLDAIDALLANRATLDQQSYAIGGRSLARIPVPELLIWRQKYAARVKAEETVSRLEAGIGARRIQVRL